MKRRKLFPVLMVLAVLLALLPGAALAQEEGELKGIFGKVVEVKVPEGGPATLSLKTRQGPIDVLITSETLIKLPPRKEASLSDIAAGARVAVLAQEREGTLVARRVLVVPPKPVHRHIRGVITGIKGNTVTVTTAKGEEVNIELPRVEGLKKGELALFVVIKTPGVKKVKAKALRRAMEVRARLSRLARRVAERAPASPEEKARLEKLRMKLKELLQRNWKREQEVLQRVLSRAPAEARPALRKALERARKKLKKAPAPRPEATPEPEE